MAAIVSKALLSRPHAVLRDARNTLPALASGRFLAFRRFATPSTSLLQDLQVRQLLHSTSAGCEEHLGSSTPRTVYCGFDPTARSLHVGNLVMIMGLARCVQHGHHAIAVVGGATGRIGDPSGRNTERDAMAISSVQDNINSIHSVLSRVLSNVCKDSSTYTIVNNASWYEDMSIIDFIGSVGRHFRVSQMLAKESVKARLQSDEGMSFAEFTYQTFQAYDFAELFSRHNCTVQLGGSDQWGNLTAGTDLIRRMHDGQAYGVTLPLLTTSSGEKFGKSAGNAVWLSEDMTSAYDLYQFFVNVADSDVELYLKALTLLNQVEIEQIMTQHLQDSSRRQAQSRLASYVVRAIHGEQGVAKANAATSLLHGRAELVSLQKDDILSIADIVPVVQVSKQEQDSVSMLDVLASLSIFASKADVRRTIKLGGVKINDTKLADPNMSLASLPLVADEFMIVRRGKKTMALIHWT